MAFGVKTNERPGTRAQVRYMRMSAYKAREVLDLIRGKHIVEADEVLHLVERDAAIVIRKCLASAVANAANNDGQDPDNLYVSACYADEGPTLKRWRPRARGRATRIRKRTCHITVIVSRQSDQEIRRRVDHEASAGGGRSRRGQAAQAAERRSRVARSRQRNQAAEHEHDEGLVDDDVDEVAAPATSAEAQLAAQDADVELAETGASAMDVPDDATVAGLVGDGDDGDDESDSVTRSAEAEIATQDADAELNETAGEGDTGEDETWIGDAGHEKHSDEGQK